MDHALILRTAGSHQVDFHQIPRLLHHYTGTPFNGAGEVWSLNRTATEDRDLDRRGESLRRSDLITQNCDLGGIGAGMLHVWDESPISEPMTTWMIHVNHLHYDNNNRVLDRLRRLTGPQPITVC